MQDILDQQIDNEITTTAYFNPMSLLNSEVKRVQHRKSYSHAQHFNPLVGVSSVSKKKTNNASYQVNKTMKKRRDMIREINRAE